MKVLIAPDGRAITRPGSYSFNCPELEIGDDGTAGQGSFDDFPTFEALKAPGLTPLLNDVDGNEWLEEHCRLIEVDEDFCVYDDVLEDLAWDQPIIDACLRVSRHAGTLWLVDLLTKWTATDVLEDPTVDVAINTILLGRVRSEVDRLRAEIATYRATRQEVTSWVRPTPERELEDALAMLRGGV